MKLESIQLHGLGPFKDFAVDLADYGDAKLVAVTGQNGAGKTSLLEMWGPGALYRQTPTRGSLASLATARDSRLDVVLVNGSRWRISHMVDAVSGKGESLVLDEQGEPATPDAKVRSFDAFSASHFPPQNLLLASVFGAQGSTGFLGMKRADRIDVILRAVGADHLEELAKRAREHARETKAQIATLEARIADERARSGDLEALAGELVLAREKATQAEEEAQKQRVELARVRAADAERQAQLEQVQAKRQARIELGLKRDVAVDRVADLERRIGNNRAVLDRANEIRAAAKRAEELQGTLDMQRRTVEVLDRDRQQAEADARRYTDEAGDLMPRIAALKARVERQQKRLADRERVEEAAASIPLYEDELRREREYVGQAEKKLEELRGQRAAGAVERLVEMREGLDAIIGDAWDNVAAVQTFASEMKTADDKAAELVEALPAALEAADQEVDVARDAAALAERVLGDARRLADRAGDMEAAAADLAEAEQDIARLQARWTDLMSTAKEMRPAIEQLHRQHQEARAAVEHVEHDLQAARRIAREAEPLARAEARIAELEPQVEAARKERDALDAQLSATPEPQDPPPLPAPGSALLRDELAITERRAREAHAAVGAVEGKLEAARAGAQRLEELQRDLADQHEELSDWKRLGDELGRDGLQSAEVDCAGPELTELVNDLIRTCYGPRWTLRIDTQRLDSTGKRLLDGCDVNVIDTVRGREGPAETFSGGERAFLSEAVALALSMLSCRRSGMVNPTLVRDEPTAALDPDATVAYIAMLRRAVDLVGADKVLFVSHNPAAQELADATIEIGERS